VNEERTRMDAPTVLDLSRLEEVFGEDRAAMADLLESAMRTGAGYQATLQTAVTGTDWEGARKAAHSIKGSAALFGGDEVAAIALQVELAARAADLAQAQQTLPQLDAAYDRLRAAVAAFRASIS